MTKTLPQLGLAAGAAGWKAGHAAVQSGALVIDGLDDDADQTERLETYAAELARVYMYAFSRGALDQALDGGALLR